MKILQDVSLNDKNWFKTGGLAKFFCTAGTELEFQEALEFAHKNNLQIFVLGEGANVLISDEGFDGLVIKPALKDIFIYKNEELIEAQAGVNIQDLIDYCLKNNLIELEEFSGIPGTVGGSIYINIHYFDRFLSDFLSYAKVIEKTSGKIIKVDKSWFNFGYDTSRLHEKNYYLISATFNLEKTNDIKTAYAKGRRDEIIRHRKRRYPTSNTCGSFFRNFEEHEINFEIENKKIPYIAYYLDKIGVKGELRVGNAIVSHQHANMLATLPNATSSDVVNLAKKIQQLVSDKFGIIPKPECQLIGFEEYPLLK